MSSTGALNVALQRSLTAPPVVGNANNEFDIVGTNGVTYHFDYLTTGWTVSRSTDYIDRFGAVLKLNDPVDITVTADINPATNVPSNNANSRLTITMVDPSSTAGESGTVVAGGASANANIDFSDFFNALSHTSAGSLAATSTTTPSYYMNYPDLEDPCGNPILPLVILNNQL